LLGGLLVGFLGRRVLGRSLVGGLFRGLVRGLRGLVGGDLVGRRLGGLGRLRDLVGRLDRSLVRLSLLGSGSLRRSLLGGLLGRRLLRRGGGLRLVGLG